MKRIAEVICLLRSAFYRRVVRQIEISFFIEMRVSFRIGLLLARCSVHSCVHIINYAVTACWLSLELQCTCTIELAMAVLSIDLAFGQTYLSVGGRMKVFSLFAAWLMSRSCDVIATGSESV